MESADKANLFTPVIFPPPGKDGGGIVAVTERLDRDILYSAYLQGVFPWYNEARGEPVAWWSPDPRFVLLPEEFRVPRRLARFVRHTPYEYTMDADFEAVINGCASAGRSGREETWIGPAMVRAYCDLFRAGLAHSVEAWRGGRLAGGFYGVLVGQVFFGESMFTLEADSAKSALVLFVEAFRCCGGRLVDSQVYTDNIARFGGRNISRTAFLRLERDFLSRPLSRPLGEAFADAARGLR